MTHPADRTPLVAVPLNGCAPPVTVDVDDRSQIAPRSGRRRDSITLTARVGNHKVHLGITRDADGKPIKLKIDVHKVGAMYRSAVRAVAAFASKALAKYPLADVVEGLRDVDEPEEAVTGHDTITRARGVLDFAGQVLEHEAGGRHVGR